MMRCSAAVTLAITLGQVLAGRRNGWSDDQELVLSALRRSTKKLADADEDMLASYLSGLSPEQMRGVVSNVKGIYHELLVARAENIDGDAVAASLFEAANHPGADIEFILDGDVIRDVQLKAVQTPDAIMDHLERYPDIDVLATSEVSAVLGGIYGDQVMTSGFSNEALTEETRRTLETLAGEDIGDFLQDGLLMSPLLGGALVARSALEGRMPSRTDLKSILELAGISAGAAFAVDALLDLV